MEFTQEYATHFMPNTYIWMQKLELVKQYINQNIKTPSTADKNPEIKSLAMWLSHQKKSYEQNGNIMREPEIRKLWEEFTQEYATHFLRNTEIWMQKLEQVKQYINQNIKTPSTADKNPEIKSLAMWLSHQKKSYEQNGNIMREPEIPKLWEEFTQEYATHFLRNLDAEIGASQGLYQ